MDTLAHGIGVTNRFELFLDEETDPLEILRKQEEEKLKRKVEKTQIKSKPTKVAKSNVSPKKPEGPPKAVKIVDSEVPNKPRIKNDRPPRNYTESKEVDKNFRNKDDQFFNPEQRDEFRRGGRGGFRGGRGGRGGERGRGYFPNTEGRNRRMFDRHSGSDKTGVRSTEKREGAGSNNWGDIRSDINQRRDDSTWDEDFEGGEKPRESANWGDDLNESAKFGETEGAPKPEGTSDNPETTEADQTTDEQIQDAVKEMTLDEYKKEQEARRAVPKYNLRKPGEGEDDKQWKKSYMLKKKQEEESDQDEEEELEDEETTRKAQQKVDLDILFNFADSRRGNRGRGRGGRGGPRGIGARDNPNRDSPREDRPRENRGGRGTGPAKPKAGHQAAPRVDDFNDFPSLVNA